MKGLFIVSGLGIFAMLAEIFKFKKILYPLVLVGLVAAYLINFTEWNFHWESGDLFPLFSKMIRFDNPALAFSGVLLIVAFFWFIFSHDYFSKQEAVTEHFALVLFTLTGALMLTSFQNMVTLFLGIEIMSIPLYVLAASRKTEINSNEAGLKYLIMGSFATGFLLFGIALIYGATGTFDIQLMHAKITATNKAMPLFFYTGVLFVLIAMLFKVSAAPFHFWAPDVYQGSPTVVTAFMSTIVKTAAFAAFMKLFIDGLAPCYEQWAKPLAYIIALSLLIANITAASQNNVKRMLAFSSISHAAFMLMALLAAQNLDASLSDNIKSSLLYYSLAYSVGSITAFTIFYYVSKANNNESIDAYNGFGKTSPLMAACMVLALFSLAGIPVTAGFFAKYYIFTLVMATGSFKWLLILAVITSAVGVYYYFKIIIAMYFKPVSAKNKIPFPAMASLIVTITTLISLAIGLMPNVIIEMLIRK